MDIKEISREQLLEEMAYLICYCHMLYVDIDGIHRGKDTQLDSLYISDKIYNAFRRMGLQGLSELKEKLWYFGADELKDCYYTKIGLGVIKHNGPILEKYL